MLLYCTNVTQGNKQQKRGLQRYIFFTHISLIAINLSLGPPYIPREISAATSVINVSSFAIDFCYSLVI